MSRLMACFQAGTTTPRQAVQFKGATALSCREFSCESGIPTDIAPRSLTLRPADIVSYMCRSVNPQAHDHVTASGQGSTRCVESFTEADRGAKGKRRAIAVDARLSARESGSLRINVPNKSSILNAVFACTNVSTKLGIRSSPGRLT